MARLAYVHWNAVEAAEHAAALRASGHQVAVHSETGRSPSALLRGVEERFDAVVVDLRRLPSHGVEVATWVRGRKASAHVPVLFVEGDAQKTKAAVARVEGTVAVAFDHLPEAIASLRPGATAPARAAKRTTTKRSAKAAPDPAGYSGTPLPRKLGIAEGARVVAPNAPKHLRELLQPFPEGAVLVPRFAPPFDVALLFCRSSLDLDDLLPRAQKALGDGLLWVCWPKKTSGVPTDLTEDVVRKVALATGLVDTKVCAVDATWSGLRLSRRRR